MPWRRDAIRLRNSPDLCIVMIDDADLSSGSLHQWTTASPTGSPLGEVQGVVTELSQGKHIGASFDGQSRP